MQGVMAKDPGGTGKPTFGRALFNSIKFDDDLFHAFDVAVGHHANGFWRDRGGKLELDWVQPGMKEAWGWWRARWAEKVFEPDSLTPADHLQGPGLERRHGRQPVRRLDGHRHLASSRYARPTPKAELVAGPALKGPKGAQGLHRRGLPVGLRASRRRRQVAEQAVKLIDWTFQPKQAARFTCEGELDYTLKALNEKGYCVEYTTQEKIAMGAEWNDRVNRAQDIVAYGGWWLPLGGNAVRPWLLNTMPADMKAHFEGVLKARYSPAALQGMEHSMKFTKTTGKKRPTKSEKQYWPAMQTRFLEVMTQVVAGTLPLEQGWTDWQAFFQKSGGPTLTQEVNDIK